MNTWDEDIYASEEYKARIGRAKLSLENTRQPLHPGSVSEIINTAAESIAYWQMRAVLAEKFLYDEGHESFRRRSERGGT